MVCESFWMIHYKESFRESFVHESNSTVHIVVIRGIRIVSLTPFVSLFWMIYWFTDSFDHESDSTDHTVVIRLIQIVSLRLFVSLFDWFITRNWLESHLSISQTSRLTV